VPVPRQPPPIEAGGWGTTGNINGDCTRGTSSGGTAPAGLVKAEAEGSALSTPSGGCGGDAQSAVGAGDGDVGGCGCADITGGGGGEGEGDATPGSANNGMCGGLRRAGSDESAGDAALSGVAPLCAASDAGCPEKSAGAGEEPPVAPSSAWPPRRV